jgi:hypothetical protein
VFGIITIPELLLELSFELMQNLNLTFHNFEEAKSEQDSSHELDKIEKTLE